MLLYMLLFLAFSFASEMRNINIRKFTLMHSFPSHTQIKLSYMQIERKICFNFLMLTNQGCLFLYRDFCLVVFTVIWSQGLALLCERWLSSIYSSCYGTETKKCSLIAYNSIPWLNKMLKPENWVYSNNKVRTSEL